jgi:hypothetical protein
MGRPPGRVQGQVFQMRASAAFLKSVDKWRQAQVEQPSRAEAIRQLVEQALATTAARPPRKAVTKKATEIAGRAIDQIGDRSATSQERASRKKALIAGPKEFRGLRRDK